MRKKPSREIAASYEWPEELWGLVERLAVGKSGPEVVKALSVASRKVYSTGADKIFARYSGRTGLSDAATAAYDIGWLQAWAIELNQT